MRGRRAMKAVLIEGYMEKGVFATPFCTPGKEYIRTHAAFFYSCRMVHFVPVEQLARHEYINSRKWNDERTGVHKTLEGRSLVPDQKRKNLKAFSRPSETARGLQAGLIRRFWLILSQI